MYSNDPIGTTFVPILGSGLSVPTTHNLCSQAGLPGMEIMQVFTSPVHARHTLEPIAIQVEVILSTCGVPLSAAPYSQTHRRSDFSWSKFSVGWHY